MAVLWGFNPALGAFLSALVMSGLVTWFQTGTAVRDDTAIGLLFVGMLALGVTIISKTGSFKTDVTVVLFGDSLGITSADIRNQIIYTSIVVLCTVLLYRPFPSINLQSDESTNPRNVAETEQAALLALLSLAIVASFQAIGDASCFSVCSSSTSNSNLTGTKSSVNYDRLYPCGLYRCGIGFVDKFPLWNSRWSNHGRNQCLEFLSS
ncbi:MAG: hypothetical protein CM15mP49_25310 [Actinomycetota bacterium]|nr:MAG: hypothetical protein CM15mP49_25310 [Actinomycetota bacterium]